MAVSPLAVVTDEDHKFVIFFIFDSFITIPLLVGKHAQSVRNTRGVV